MDLGNNSFQGTIPNVFEEFIQLEGLILNGNQLKGGVPSSLSKCEFLGVLDLGNNHLNGTFPSWLGELCFPQVLVLKSNNFHGNIQPSFAVKFLFLCLRVLDLSHNGFVVTVLRDSDSVLVWPREETGDLSRVFERSNSTKCTISHGSEGEGEAGVWFKSKRIGNVAMLGCCGCGLNDLRLSFEGKCSHGVMVFGENEHVLDGVWHCCLRLIVSFIRYRVMVSDINFAWYPRYLLFAFCIADVFQRSRNVYCLFMRPDAKDVKLKLEPEGKFSFSATAGADNVPYEIDVNLHDKVDVNESKSSVGSRSIVYHIKKEESKWWNRLLKQEGKAPAFVNRTKRLQLIWTLVTSISLRHHTPAFSKGLRSTDPLHRDPGHGKNEACLIGWEERSQLHAHVLIVVNGVPKQKELK
ncbi:leucine-rich repeat-containing protein [Tanacetum coccineum]